MYYQVEQVLEKQEPEIEKFYKGRGILIYRLFTESRIFVLAGDLPGAAGDSL